MKCFCDIAQTICPLGDLRKAKDVLTEGVDARLARDRSKLWGPAWSWGVGLLGHRGPWFHTRSAGLLSLGEGGIKKQREIYLKIWKNYLIINDRREATVKKKNDTENKHKMTIRKTESG